MKRAFTIIELLIVIAVIAILVGIALPRFKGMQDEGNIAKAKGELNTVKAAVESYYSHHANAYPAAGTVAADLTGATPNILSVMPADPFSTTGANYGYVVSGNGRYYAIWSVGPTQNGSVTALSDAGVVTEANGASCIYVTNGSSIDTAP